ncbi:hypothetical protein QYF36_010256 [Acer negundo]|nr:hypothetical protein QYF36_010256 [Acer negundo]
MNLIKINGVKSFTYGEMALATNNFSSSSQVGQGGYGKVYKGILEDGARLHHRNLVSLVGYCNEEGDQMLVYEFMSRGTLRDQLFRIRDFPKSPYTLNSMVDEYGIHSCKGDSGSTKEFI